jgi:hypothetical protein
LAPCVISGLPREEDQPFLLSASTFGSSLSALVNHPIHIPHMTRYKLDVGIVLVLFPVGTEQFCLVLKVHTASGTSSYMVCIGGGGVLPLGIKRPEVCN